MSSKRTALLPRKAPQQARSASMMQSILDAATRVLEKQGVHAYNTGSIADQAGASIGSVYQYFPNRDAVTAALILKAHCDLLAALRGAMERTQGLLLEQALPALIEVAIPPNPGAWKVMRFLELEEERLPRTDELLVAEAEIQAINIRFLRRYLPVNRLSNEIIELTSFDVVSIIRGMIDATLARSGPGDSVGLSERISRAVVGYLRPLMNT